MGRTRALETDCVTAGRSVVTRVLGPLVRGGLVLTSCVVSETVTGGRVPRVTAGRVPLVGGGLVEGTSVSRLRIGGEVGLVRRLFPRVVGILLNGEVTSIGLAVVILALVVDFGFFGPSIKIVSSHTGASQPLRHIFLKCEDY